MPLGFDQILEWGSFALTVMVMLYLFVGDNALFRVVSYTFIGVAAGYVAVQILFQVLIPRLITPLLQGNFLVALPLLLGFLLLLRLSPRLTFLGSWSMAVLVGVGAAVAIGGAVFGTIFGQVSGTLTLIPSVGEVGASISQGALTDRISQLGEGLFVLIGTICTLAYFQFGVANRPNMQPQRARFVEGLSLVGQVFIGMTLGATFAGVYAAAISAFIERVGFLIKRARQICFVAGSQDDFACRR